MTIPLFRLIKLFFLLCLFNTLSAQDIESGLNSYYSYSIDYRLNKKSRIKFGQLYCINPPYRLQYIQQKVGWSHRLHKKWDVNAYYKVMFFRGNNRNLWYHRLSTELKRRDELFGLPLQNSINSEFFFPRLNKFQYRFIYTLKYSFKNKILPLRATPYIKYQLYYYLNGKPLNYYDESGEVLLASQSPNDFHRFRLGGGIRFRAAKYFYITLYYTWQEEFNTLLTKNREINILNQSQTKIKYPYNDYQVIGLSLSYSIKRKKKKKK